MIVGQLLNGLEPASSSLRWRDHLLGRIVLKMSISVCKAPAQSQAHSRRLTKGHVLASEHFIQLLKHHSSTRREKLSWKGPRFDWVVFPYSTDEATDTQRGNPMQRARHRIPTLLGFPAVLCRKDCSLLQTQSLSKMPHVVP